MVRLAASLFGLAALAAPLASAFKCHGINYNIRAGPDWATAEDKCKSAEQIQTELATLKTVTDTIRIYSLTDCDQYSALVPVAIAAGFKVVLGLWTDAAGTFYTEKTLLEQLLQSGVINANAIEGISVGSEAIYRGDVNVSTAIEFLGEIRELTTTYGVTDIPLTITDVGNTYLHNQELFDAVDVASVNLFPFWDKVDAKVSATYFYSTYTRLADIAAKQDKEVIVGETGWATDGYSARASECTPENAATYFYDFYNLAKEKDITYYYFAAFDESYKLEALNDTSSVEGYFGIFDEAGVMKSAYANLVFPEDEVTESASASTDSDSASGSEDSGLQTESTAAPSASEDGSVAVTTQEEEEDATETSTDSAADDVANTDDEEEDEDESSTDNATATSESTDSTTATTETSESAGNAATTTETSESTDSAATTTETYDATPAVTTTSTTETTTHQDCDA